MVPKSEEGVHLFTRSCLSRRFQARGIFSMGAKNTPCSRRPVCLLVCVHLYYTVYYCCHVTKIESENPKRKPF